MQTIDLATAQEYFHNADMQEQNRIMKNVLAQVEWSHLLIAEVENSLQPTTL